MQVLDRVGTNVPRLNLATYHQVKPGQQTQHLCPLHAIRRVGPQLEQTNSETSAHWYEYSST